MKTPLLIAALVLSLVSAAQYRFSIATNPSVLRNLTPRQGFWSFGQHVEADLHFSATEAAYLSLDYYKEGKFKNPFTATAKLPLTTPQDVAFTATGRLRYRQLSLGWKHYFTGTASATGNVNFFGLAGLGLVFGAVKNSAAPVVDTFNYTSPVAFGQGKAKRLSLDLGAGGEKHLGGPLYVYATVRAWLPASYHPVRYLHNSDRVPLSLMAGVGLRVLFGLDY